ncbi:MAG: aminoacyl-tRNA hydrolase [Firmicutes bacterium]|nr:aminoacyl-tRNA hydrolase [Bacillota bacterium]
MKLLVGLGNPGRKYVKTRHNVGFLVIERLADKLDIPITRPFFRAQVGQVFIAGEKVILAKPQTFMNASGQSVAPLLNWYKLSLADLMVVYDDLDLTPGVMRIRPKGGSGGHRGMASIMEHLGSGDFARLRVGIGKPEPDQRDTSDWVLGKFDREEKKEIEATVEKAVDALHAFVKEGINQAMNRYNV